MYGTSSMKTAEQYRNDILRKKRVIVNRTLDSISRAINDKAISNLSHSVKCGFKTYYCVMNEVRSKLEKKSFVVKIIDKTNNSDNIFNYNGEDNKFGHFEIYIDWSDSLSNSDKIVEQCYQYLNENEEEKLEKLLCDVYQRRINNIYGIF